MRRLQVTRPQENCIERKLRKRDFSNFPEYLDYLYSLQKIDDWPLKIHEKGSLLRRTGRVQAQRDTQEKSEFNITALLLPERFKLTPYYETLPSEMNEKQKALAVRWRRERKYGFQDGLSPIMKRIKLPRILSDQPLYQIIHGYYGKLNKHEACMIIAILYSLWDIYDGYYDSIASYLISKHNKLFPTRKEVNKTVQHLVDKGIVKLKIRFKESRNEKLLKPQRILNVVRC